MREEEGAHLRGATFADNCAHCGVCLRGRAHIMSMYDTSWICLGCKQEERKRPDYKLAEARDMEVYASKLDSLGMGPQADNVRSLAAKLRKEVNNECHTDQ